MKTIRILGLLFFKRKNGARRKDFEPPDPQISVSYHFWHVSNLTPLFNLHDLCIKPIEFTITISYSPRFNGYPCKFRFTVATSVATQTVFAVDTRKAMPQIQDCHDVQWRLLGPMREKTITLPWDNRALRLRITAYFFPSGKGFQWIWRVRAGGRWSECVPATASP